MNYKELTEKHCREPAQIFEDFYGYASASPDAFFLYEIHLMGYNFWESSVWIFESIAEFKQFLPVLLFSWEASHSQDHDFEETVAELNYEEQYTLYIKALSEDWQSPEDCNRFLKELAGTGSSAETIGIEFGAVSDLLNVSAEEFDKCKEDLFSEEDLEKAGLSQGRYKIFNRYWESYEMHPSENEEQFLEMLDGWGE
jgi:hypothetical protein